MTYPEVMVLAFGRSASAFAVLADVREDLERFYLEHHWRNMSYWLRRGVVVVLVYSVLTAIFGKNLLLKSMDVRLDHYAKEPEKRKARSHFGKQASKARSSAPLAKWTESE